MSSSKGTHYEALGPQLIPAYRQNWDDYELWS